MKDKSADSIKRVGIVLRNLIKILSENHRDNIGQIIQYLELGVEKLRMYGVKELYDNNYEELQWVFSISWNLGLEYFNIPDYTVALSLFHACFEYACFIPESINILEYQKYALIHKCICRVQVSKRTSASLDVNNKYLNNLTNDKIG